MAKSLESHRSNIQTSIHGRRLGLSQDDVLLGAKGLAGAVTNATSDTTGTALAGYGFHTVSTTTNDVWTLSDPIRAGLEVKIATATTSTGNHAIVPAAATIVSTNGVAGSSIIMQGVGASVTLLSLSTAAWTLSSRTGSTTAGATVVVSS